MKSFNKWRPGYLVIVLSCMLMMQQARGQSIPVDSVLHTLEKVYKIYDSIVFLSFDVRFNYSSDTLLGNYTNEQLDGSYTLAGRRAKYTLGNIDFMQNDSFFIAVYNSDKLILVDEPKNNNTGSQLPLRSMMDSLLRQYNNHYNISQNIVGEDTSVITFIRSDSLAQFDNFRISFDRRNYYLYKLDYQYTEGLHEDSTIVYPDKQRKQRLTIQFSNYTFSNYEDSVYDENNYIYFEKGVCKPVSKYSNYKVYNSKPVTNTGEAEQPQ